jgi:hypothetical protein
MRIARLLDTLTHNLRYGLRTRLGNCSELATRPNVRTFLEAVPSLKKAGIPVRGYAKEGDAEKVEFIGVA